MSEFQVVGFGAAFERLAEDKCALMSQPVSMVLWILYWAGTIIPMALVLALRGQSPHQPRPQHYRKPHRHQHPDI